VTLIAKFRTAPVYAALTGSFRDPHTPIRGVVDEVSLDLIAVNRRALSDAEAEVLLVEAKTLLAEAKVALSEILFEGAVRESSYAPDGTSILAEVETLAAGLERYITDESPYAKGRTLVIGDAQREWES
jgi:hypothetical protein